MKLLVMGAGYVGEALLKHLQNRPHEIYITTTDETRLDTLRVYGQNVLLLKEDENHKLFEWIRICDAMIIMVAPSKSRNYEETYLNTAKTIASALENRLTPFYLLYTSSTSVFEGKKSEWVTEDMELKPTSVNGNILAMTEHCYLKCKVFTCILRLGGIYGPKRELIDRARRFSEKEMPGNGNESTNHIHLDDIVSAITFCLNRSLTGVYNLVNNDHTTRKELYSNLCKQMKIPPPIWDPMSTEHTRSGYKVSNEKIKNAGFSFKHLMI